MRILRRYWALVLVICLIPLLAALAWFQISSISAIGKRERFRLEQGLNESVNQLSRAIQNEIGILSALFVLGHSDIESRLKDGNWADFQQRWESWRAWAVDPGIVADFHILDAGGRQEPWQGQIWIWNGERFVPDKNQGIGKKLSAGIPDRDPGRGLWVTEKLLDGTEAFLLPLAPDRGFWLVIRIDPEAFATKLIPQLADRYLSGKGEYLYRIVDQENGKTIYQSEKGLSAKDFAYTDITYPLLHFGPPFLGDHFDNQNSHPMDERLPKEPPPDRGDLRRAMAPMRDHAPPEGGALDLPKSRWILEAVHRSGSLSAAVLTGDLSSTIVSLAILLLLGISLIVLALSLKRTQELTERQSEFIASVTHELKTPVAVIQSAADNLEVGLVSSPEQMSRYGTAIKKESHRLSEMIDRLLSYARIKGSQHQNLQIVDLAQLIEQILEDFSGQLSSAGFQVETALEKEVFIPADATSLGLVFGNLIANALKHAKDGKYLSVELRSEPPSRRNKAGTALVRISDRGPGIPRRERRRIFEAFYRGSIAKDGQVPGSGLGLNIAYRIIQSHGGNLAIDTHTTEGTAFLITLPQEQLHA